MNRTIGRRAAGFLAALAAVLAMAGFYVPAATAAPFNNTGNCGTVKAFVVPGTTETQVGASPNSAKGISGDWGTMLQQRIPGANVTSVDYPAQVGGGVAGLVTGSSTKEIDSVSYARNNLAVQMQDFTRNCPNTEMVLFGFSQGAQAAGDVCAAVGRSELPGVSANKIRSCELIGDPRRGAGDKLMGGVAPGGGLLGAGRNFGQLGNRVYSACATADPICANKATAFSNGLGGGQATQQVTSPLTSQQDQALLDFLNIKPSWEGSNGIFQTVADAAGPWVAFQQQHNTYGDKSPIYGGNSAIGSSVDRIAGGKTQPLGSSAAQQAAAQPNVQVANGVAGLSQVLGGVDPATAAVTPVTGQAVTGSQVQGLQLPGQSTTATTPGINTSSPWATSNPLQNVNQQGLGQLVGLLAGTR